MLVVRALGTHTMIVVGGVLVGGGTCYDIVTCGVCRMLRDRSAENITRNLTHLYACQQVLAGASFPY